MGFRCVACGTGKVRPVKISGRIWRYKHMDMELPENIPIPTCDNCGEEWLDKETCKLVGEALELLYQLKTNI